MKTWKDIYELPFEFPPDEDGDDFFVIMGRVYDAKNQFVFEFLRVSPDAKLRILSIINGEDELKFKKGLIKFEYNKSEQVITTEVNNEKINVIRIRGWGNLTGIGGHNLKSEEAANIQDTLGEYIIERLNGEK